MPPNVAIDSIARLPPINMPPLLRDRANAATNRATGSIQDRDFTTSFLLQIIFRTPWDPTRTQI